MGKINILQKQVADLIAAGEVVERPASAVKEMIENSIDAGATLITVEIKNGGITYLRVSDNGSGIAPEDVPLVFLRHATSKIACEEDLNHIGTLGFRGEAMASIAAVSRVELLTKTAKALEGVRYIIHGGEEVEQGAAGCPQGTTIIARDLFYNTPARMKFLKKDSSEANSVAAAVEKAALAHPEISFKLIREGQIKLHTPGDSKLISAIHAVYGRDFASSMVPVQYESNGIIAEGYLCKPAASRGNRTMQSFFINGRFVKSRTMMAALEEAYKHSIMVGKFPACVLNLKVAYSETDVNVHPAKIEVRFSNEKLVFDTVYYGVKSALQQHDYSLNLNAPPKKGNPYSFEKPREIVQTKITAQEFRKQYAAEPLPQKAERGVSPSPQKESFPRENQWQNSLLADCPAQSYYQAGTAKKQTRIIDSEEKTACLKENILTSKTPLQKNNTKIPPNSWEKQGAASLEPKENKCQTPVPSNLQVAAAADGKWEGSRLIGELFATYILLENQSELLIIDKHAAHERLLFQQLKKLDLTSSRQCLLAPVVVTLSKEDYQGVLEGIELFEKIGFLVEDFGGQDILVREVPVSLPECDIRAIVEEAAHNIALHKNDLTPEVVDSLLHNIACRSAVKAHDKNTAVELEQIVQLLRENEDVKYCPHGRPIARILTKRDLEKMFGRTN